MRGRRRALRAFAVILETALVVSLMACSSDSERENPPQEPYMLIYYDGHMHTVRSDGSGDVAQIKETAIRRDLSAVIITDHCAMLTREKWDSLLAETKKASDDSFLALPGFEITGNEGLLNRDHILAYGVADPFVGDDASEACPEEVWPSEANPDGYGPKQPENLAKWVDFVHSQGGIAVHAHPVGTTRLEYGVDNIEVYNQSQLDDITRYAKLLEYSDEESLQFALMLGNFATYGGRDLDLPVRFPGLPEPIPARLALLRAAGLRLGPPEAPLQSWDDLIMAYVDGRTDQPVFALANTDAHNTGDPDSKVGLAKNGLYVRRLSEEEVYAAIKAGRSFATTGPSLTFTVEGKLMGETARVGGSATLNLSVNAESASAVLEKVDIIKNGEILKTVNPESPAYEETLEDSVTGSGYYRIEVTSYDASSGRRYFAWSNPVFFESS
jgi:hypothetical protein